MRSVSCAAQHTAHNTEHSTQHAAHKNTTMETAHDAGIHIHTHGPTTLHHHSRLEVRGVAAPELVVLPTALLVWLFIWLLS